MHKPTPGPWAARGGGHNYTPQDEISDRSEMMDWCSSVDCIAPFTENEHGGYERVEVQPVAKGYGRTLEEAQANARLIAAVPELLAVLIDARERMLGNSPSIKALRERADAAIASATGGAT